MRSSLLRTPTEAAREAGAGRCYRGRDARASASLPSRVPGRALPQGAEEAPSATRGGATTRACAGARAGRALDRVSAARGRLSGSGRGRLGVGVVRRGPSAGKGPASPPDRSTRRGARRRSAHLEAQPPLPRRGGDGALGSRGSCQLCEGGPPRRSGPIAGPTRRRGARSSTLRPRGRGRPGRMSPRQREITSASPPRRTRTRHPSAHGIRGRKGRDQPIFTLACRAACAGAVAPSNPPAP